MVKPRGDRRMRKQEQIEKIAKVMYGYICGDDKCKTCISNSQCISYRDAKDLYDAGYRRISENAVVLTKKEYERLKNDRKIRVVTKHEEDDYEVCIPASDYDEMLKQERKETAKEFAEKLKSKLYDLEGIVQEDDIDELLKEYGVEVE